MFAKIVKSFLHWYYPTNIAFTYSLSDAGVVKRKKSVSDLCSTINQNADWQLIRKHIESSYVHFAVLSGQGDIQDPYFRGVLAGVEMVDNFIKEVAGLADAQKQAR
jgi:hypothetical protein